MNTKKPFLQPLHAGVSVANLDESIAWYTDMLGFSLVSRDYVPPLNGTIAFLQHGNFSIELFEIKNSAPLPEYRREPDDDIAVQGNKHTAYKVEDLTGLVNELKKKGVDIAKDIFQMNDTIVCFIRDNTGNLIEFIQDL